MKKLLLILTLFLYSFQTYSQELWVEVSEKDVTKNEIKTRHFKTSKELLFQFDIDAFKIKVQNAPILGSPNSDIILPFPDSDGKIQHFKIFESPVLHPDLAVKYPDIKSYIGQGIENPSYILRFSITIFGMNAMVLAPDEGDYYIDPYSTDGKYYSVYARKNLTAPRTFKCHSKDSKTEKRLQNHTPLSFTNGIRRTYRTAIVTTTEYSDFHIEAAGLQFGTLTQKKAAVLSAVTITITRVSAMFERDFSIFLQLIPNQDEVIFIDNDNLTNDELPILINEITTTLDTIIGTENYDLGHGFGTFGGGIAGFKTLCYENYKGHGVTGVTYPIGDPFDIDYVAHEVAHQFGASHTFNNECNGNRDQNWSYETGSGSTILAYAGVCDPNIQNYSDTQFFSGSIYQIKSCVNDFGGSCAIQSNTFNSPPVISAGNDYIIPKGTAFILTGTATDENNDALTYTWEQYDKQITTQPPLATATEGPNFKTKPISSVPFRYIPSLSDVLQNNLTPTWEVISNVGREYNFAFTVRDNNINGGESVTDFMKVQVDPIAGPFVITSPNFAVNWTAASNHTVTWNVAGTNQNSVNCAYVDILLSTDGGLNFNHVLAKKVPNDGSEIITVPNIPGSSNRILVRGHGNIFYDVNNQNFTIVYSPPTFLFDVIENQNISICKGSDVNYTFNLTNINGFTGNTTLTVSGLPENATANFLSSNSDIQMNISNTSSSPNGFYTITVTATSGDIVKTKRVYLNLLNSNFDVVNLINPPNLAQTVNTTTTLQWETSDNINLFELQMATDSNFSNIIHSETLTSTNYVVNNLSEGTDYFWRVKLKNEVCEGLFSEVNQFTTGVTTCINFESTNVPLMIPSNVATTIYSTLYVPQSLPFFSVSVNLNISHTWLMDISVKLISPLGSIVNLFSNQCNDYDDVNATFSDSGEELHCQISPAIVGNVLPTTLLSTINHENMNGLWKLEVRDHYVLDGGSINSWSLYFCSFLPLLKVNEVNKTDFVLFPNPNRGSFNIKLNDDAKGTFKCIVYDLNGRKIYEGKPFTNSKTEHIQVNAESGMYLLVLDNEEKRITKKFIIE